MSRHYKVLVFSVMWGILLGFSSRGILDRWSSPCSEWIKISIMTFLMVALLYRAVALFWER